MSIRTTLALATVVAVCLGVTPRSVSAQPTATASRSLATRAALPMSFEPNVGQTDARVRFVARGAGYAIFLTDEGATLSLASPRPASLSMSFAGATRAAGVEPERPLPGKSHYLMGKDPSAWKRNVPTFGAVRYAGVYDGIDVLFYGTQDQLEYDFVVAPGADPSQARVRFEGQRAAEVDAAGDLVLTLEGGEVRQARAVVYQNENGRKRPVEARYVVRSGGEIGFEVGGYDPRRPLVIDPVLEYAAFLGGSSSEDVATAVAVDAAGAAYVAGWTSAVDFPTTPGAFDTTWNDSSGYSYSNNRDAYVAKLSADGSSVVYATYLGGMGADEAAAVAVDAQGRAYATGRTQALNFPTTPDAFDATLDDGTPSGDGAFDAFVSRLSADGSALEYSTFLGGAGHEDARAIGLGPAGRVVVAGSTRSYDFPVTAGAFDETFNSSSYSDDVFVVAFEPGAASLAFATFVGGYGPDVARAIAVDAAGAVYVAGETDSEPDFPTTAGAFDTTFNGSSYEYTDGFVLKLAADGSGLTWATFVGGGYEDAVKALAVDAAGAVYVTGSTTSPDFPTTPGAYQTTDMYGTRVFVTRISPDGASLGYSAVLAGYGYNDGQAIAVNSAGEVVLAGRTSSPTYPTTPGAYDTTPNGGDDVFVTKLNAAGSGLVFSTLIGGSASENPYGLAVDAAGVVTIAGSTTGAFPTTSGAFDETHNGGTDGFVARLSADGTTLAYATLLGGFASRNSSLYDEAKAIAVDATGATYVTGSTIARGFPTTPGAYDETFNGEYYYYPDTFVSKLSPDGSTLVYSTFVGGDERDAGAGIAVGPGGEATIVGTTESADFPTTPEAFDTTLGSGYYEDGFVARLSADGSSLVYSTFLGGTYYDGATGVAVDAAGAAYVTGYAVSSDFPTTPGSFDPGYNGYGHHDAFVTKVNATGSDLVYSTYLGGGGSEIGRAIAIDGTGAAVVVGETGSPSFPTTPGAFDRTFNGYQYNALDAFVTKLAPSGGALVYSSYLGGTYFDSAASVALDADGAVYVGGVTESSDFPATAGAFDTTLGTEYPYNQDGFVAKVSATGASLGFATYLGGDGDDAVAGVAVDPAGMVFVTGATRSSNFPTTPGAFDTTFNNSYYYEAFATSVQASGSALGYSTFLGGNENDFGDAIAVDDAGIVFVAGRTESSDFAVDGHGGRDGSNAFVASLAPVLAPVGDTAGVYDTSTGAWFLRNANAGGGADVVFSYGAGGALVPLVGDWDGDGVDSPGLYDPSTGAYFLKNSTAGGGADIVFTFGAGGAGAVPLAGDWDGDGVDTPGLYIQSGGVFFLRNSNSAGGADVVFTFGPGGTGFAPLVGDWDGDGADTIGLYAAGTATFFLRNANAPGGADLVFGYGPAGATPLAGDWNGDGTDTIGVCLSETAAWFLRNTNASGPADVVFSYGPTGVTPLAGNWDGE
jgi:hypothetical protein